MTQATARLRELLRSGDPIVAPGAFDPLSGRLVERAGFDVVYVGGWTTGAHTCITEPLLTMTEQLTVAERMARNLTAPLIVDGHTGYGDATHAARTVRESEAAGIAGIHIEDQLFPKRMGYHRGIKHIVPVEEATSKLQAALDARTDPDFVIIGRSDAWGAENGGMDEVITRMKAYADVGVDALMPMVFDPHEAELVRKAVPDVPMVWLAGTSGMTLKEKGDSQGRQMDGVPELSVEQIFEMGFQIVIYPIAPIVASTMAVNALLHEIKATGKCDLSGYEAGRQAIDEAISLERHFELETLTTSK